MYNQWFVPIYLIIDAEIFFYHQEWQSFLLGVTATGSTENEQHHNIVTVKT